MITMSAICSGTEISSKYGVLLQSDIVFAEVDGVKLLVDLHLPQGAENPPLVMFIHGGGWRNGNRKRCKLAWIAQSGYAVANVHSSQEHNRSFGILIVDVFQITEAQIVTTLNSNLIA
jgi:BD-FAE protein